jgi:uncharacterized protein YutE (UPF0331/DUF86 family)
MHKVPLSKVKIESKLAVIREALSALHELGERTGEEAFVESTEKFAIAEHHLRRALEGVFDIGGHIISRFPYSPGKRPKTLREIAHALGEKGIVEQSFADGALSNMAGYRNRMVHFYDEVTPRELYAIITHNLGDLEVFAQAAVAALDRPEQYDLSVEE